MWLIRQQDTPSLIRNGSFGIGLSGWQFSAGVKHHALEQGTIGSAALVNAPKFSALLPKDGFISQTFRRSDLYTYPSRRYVENVLAYPSGLKSYLVQPTFETRIDGRAIKFGAIDPIFWSGSPNDPVVVTAGDQIEVENTYFPEYGGAFRVGRYLGNYNQGVDLVEISPIDTGLVKFATDADFKGATYTFDPSSTFGNIEILGKYAFSRSGNVGADLKGFQLGDVLIFTSPDFAAMSVMGVTVESDRIQLLVRALFGTSQYGFGVVPYLPSTVIDGVLTTQPLDKWFVSPITQLNLTRSLPLFQYSFTLALSYSLGHYDGDVTLAFVNLDGTIIKEIPKNTLSNGGLYEDVSLSKSPDAATVFRRRLYHFFLESAAPIRGQLKLMIKSGSSDVVIGDVVMYKGNFTNRHDYDDRDPANTTLLADRRSAVDRLFHGLDEAEGVVPRGTVLLYVGGASCPSGWKRVDSVANSTVDGLETIPAPDDVIFDQARNRTILVWNEKSFDLLDANGEVIPILADSQTISIPLPNASPFNGAFETIRIGPVHQRLQPGMSFRIQVSDAPGGEAYAYSSIIRQAFVERSEVAGQAPASLPVESQINYPVFISGANVDPLERLFTPIGPDSTQQPTTLTTTTTNTGNQGSYGHPVTFGGMQSGQPTITVTGVNVGLVVGQLVYCRWNTNSIYSTTYSGSFVGEIVARTGNTVTVRRYDGRGMIVSGTSGVIGGDITFSDAKIFDDAVVITRSTVNGNYVWSARRFASKFKATVFGDVTNDVRDFNTAGLVLEPSGFIRFGDAGDFDYGSMGHSHEIRQGDAPFNENIAPHVSSGHENVRPTIVAKKHGHGFMPKYVFPIPRFFAGLMCEKL